MSAFVTAVPYVFLLLMLLMLLGMLCTAMIMTFKDVLWSVWPQVIQ